MKFNRLKELISISSKNSESSTQTGQLDPDTVLGERYTIVRTIGHGGMASVYEAKDTQLGTSCAIKEMSLSMVPAGECRQAIQNFQIEARILSLLDHPNLPTFTDFFTVGIRYYLVMELIEGSTLEDLLEANQGPFSERRVLGWARQLCDVLEYLHHQQPPIIFR
ncbi:MAG TPA: protein kinase, partial [Ktedonobacteraceae bacterium]|nr:protein kinase [Ktedonobacteraceae bacterium]